MHWGWLQMMAATGLTQSLPWVLSRLGPTHGQMRPVRLGECKSAPVRVRACRPTLRQQIAVVASLSPPYNLVRIAYFKALSKNNFTIECRMFGKWQSGAEGA